eukprot:9413244-Pyramimonas_sp.AAC.1
MDVQTMASNSAASARALQIRRRRCVGVQVGTGPPEPASPGLSGAMGARSPPGPNGLGRHVAKRKT